MNSKIYTGIILFALLILVCVLDIFIINFLLFGVVIYFAFLESLKLFDIKNRNLVYLALAFYLFVFIFNSNDEANFISPKLIACYVLVLASFVAYFKMENLKILYPFLYPLAPFLIMFEIYLCFGINYIFYMLFTAIVCDSGAYFVGKKFGKTSFSKSSPNKTLEGVMGGVVLASIGGALISYNLFDFVFIKAILVSFLIAIFGVFGDLFESYIKRIAGVKDSGDIFPGHGGMLDRIDAYLFASVAMYLVLV
ncbi:phosphatidate cytidylyltransferase [Campylobacter sputorum]|uniref:phosphatidate cytidylyltransferase n=1 Tax=Campylobacter sputorum TaxID=206 RepID=UPI000B783F7F|nr:phosphatidate cytidylyltransferase [Campylobacter sputorum]ASM37337.1 CDP-diglyceride synthetase [Campylobacter sputorum bv. faecalis CCUG 20703]